MMQYTNQPVYGAPTQYNGQPQNNNQMQVQNPQPIPVQSNCDFIYVSDPTQVKEYIVRPNQKLYFLDNNKPILYVKEATSVGTTNVTAMRIEEIDFNSLLNELQQPNQSSSVSETEFKELSNDIRALIERMNQQSETIKNLEEEISSIKATKTDAKQNNNYNRRDGKKC